MSKPFKETFPTLRLDTELENLLETTEVTKISANREHSGIRIYLRGRRLIFKKNIWKLEAAVSSQIFKGQDTSCPDSIRPRSCLKYIRTVF